MVGKVLWGGGGVCEKNVFKMMLLMQFQASLGMCLQGSKMEIDHGTSCTLRWKRSEKAKQEKRKVWGTAEWTEVLEGVWFLLLIGQWGRWDLEGGGDRPSVTR